MEQIFRGFNKDKNMIKKEITDPLSFVPSMVYTRRTMVWRIFQHKNHLSIITTEEIQFFASGVKCHSSDRQNTYYL